MYDWSVVIPQMQSFWKELSEIRTATSAKTLDPHPFAPPPMDYAARFPSQQMGADFVNAVHVTKIIPYATFMCCVVTKISHILLNMWKYWSGFLLRSKSLGMAERTLK